MLSLTPMHFSPTRQGPGRRESPDSGLPGNIVHGYHHIFWVALQILADISNWERSVGILVTALWFILKHGPQAWTLSLPAAVGWCNPCWVCLYHSCLPPAHTPAVLAANAQRLMPYFLHQEHGSSLLSPSLLNGCTELWFTVCSWVLYSWGWPTALIFSGTAIFLDKSYCPYSCCN